ncbi:hypothetical protein TNCV_4750161 [Trichonephila clavipes]|nr:hypothetical protein TNCV_4750161 [Trichonephila clavipes]
MKAPYVNIKSKELTSSFLVASRYICGHQNTEHRAGIRLKRRHFATLLSISFDQGARITIFLCAALSRESKVIAILLTVHATANVIAPNQWILSRL